MRQRWTVPSLPLMCLWQASSQTRAGCAPLTRSGLQTALYGLCPENIIKAAHAGFSWWIDQTGARHARRRRATPHLS